MIVHPFLFVVVISHPCIAVHRGKGNCINVSISTKVRTRLPLDQRLTKPWGNLIQNGINGKCFQVIYILYQGIKSCVSSHTTVTGYFSCCVGVRQGEHLSPLLLSLFVNDIEQEFRLSHCRGINIDELSINSLILRPVLRWLSIFCSLIMNFFKSSG